MLTPAHAITPAATMKVLTDLAALRRYRTPIVMAAGFFDGVHRGHRKVIEQAMARARRRHGQAWVLTFDTHPLKVLNPSAAPLLLTSNAHKERLLSRLGVDGCLMLPFTRELANSAPEEFVARIHACAPPLVEILVGTNWRFGAMGRGGPAMLARRSRGTALKVTVVKTMSRGGETISSTRIRAAVLQGNLGDAASLLGRPFSVLGTVTRGRTIARTLGYPTANLNCHNEALPPCGVYAVYALIGRRLLNGVLNMGHRPTFGATADDKPVIELHVLDLNADLYGDDIEVFFIARLRDEKRFSSPAELARQIARDVESARTLLSRNGLSKKVKESLYTDQPAIL